jgi:hypothetical protein
MASRALPLLLQLVMALLLALPARAAGNPDLLLEVRLDTHLLSDGISAYQQQGAVLLPLGEMARLLTIAIRSDGEGGQASGYILDEQRGFRLDLARRSVQHGGRTEPFDPALVRREGDEIYVASSLLAAWLPAAFEIDLPSLSLRVQPREKLPVQARFERLVQVARRSATAAADAALPRVDSPYALASMPFIDQTIGADLRRGAEGRATSASVTSYLTGDLLGAQAALYINSSAQPHGPAARLTLARHDPDAGLLGALHARSVVAGSMAAPGVSHIALGSALGNGVLVSNRALGQPMQVERHQLQGDLPPGWDVELYFNDALIGVQQSRADGRYSFDDLALIYGANEFRLVFHGPLGQLRVERHSFLIEQARLAPGDLVYSLAAQRDETGHARSVVQVDWGLGRRVSASAAMVGMQAGAHGKRYASLGLQAYLDSVMLHASAVRSDGGGALAQLGVRTRLAGVALNASHAWSDLFISDFYQAGIRARTDLRIDGQLAALPLVLQLRRERMASGLDNLDAAARVSAYRAGTALSHALHWQSLGGRTLADGMLQLSHRVAGMGISGQLAYALAPHAALSTVSLAADKHLSEGYLLSAGIDRAFSGRHTRLSGSINKSLGSYGFGIHAHYARRGGYGVGVQLFFSAGREPRRARWITDAVPMAGSGSLSLRAFVDRNRNGSMDDGEAPIPGAGFLLNGSSHMARTDAAGLAWIGRLAPNQSTAIALDPATLDDPQWQPLQPGLQLVPRAGKVDELDFAVGVVGEIDGTAYLVRDGARRPAGDLEVQLMEGERVLAQAVTGADGYYTFTGVAPGAYTLRLAPAQLARLKLTAPAARRIAIDRDGNFVNGQDFIVTM